MRKTLLWAGILLLLSPLTAAAQVIPQVQIFGGYFSYLSNNSPSNLIGWDIAVTPDLNDWLSVTADFSGNYGSDFLQDVSAYHFLFGPEVAYRRIEKITPFARMLFGAAHQSFTGGRSSRNAVVLGFGAGIDFAISELLAIRVIQADYLHDFYSDAGENRARLSFGAVIRLGRR